ncbi:MAG: RNA 2',3'-cyclic phosphodiesterase [Solirubrobacteraceae bacterium]
MRLFVALELPPEVRFALAAWARTAAASQRALAAVSAPSLHLTLCFLDERPVEQVDRIAAACAQGAAPAPIVELSLGAPMWLPRRRPRALAIGVRDPDGTLVALQRRVGDELVRAGLWVREARPFIGHVTVARVRSSLRGTAPTGPAAPAALPAIEPLRFQADVVNLLRSHLDAGPARYETLASVALGGGE